MDGVTGALLEPLGVAIHAVDLGHVHLGDDVAVVGCGPIGLLIAHVARAAGARIALAVDPLEHRRAAAEAAGAELVVAPDDVPGIEVDVAFEAAGTDPGVDLAMRATRPGGRLVLAGIPSDDRTSFSAGQARRRGLTIVMVRRMGEVYPRAIRLVERGAVDLSGLVTDRYPLAEAGEAFATAVTRSGLKVVVEPSA
jgi:L-iditol 2-dehydrogenase